MGLEQAALEANQMLPTPALAPAQEVNTKASMVVIMVKAASLVIPLPQNLCFVDGLISFLTA